MPESLWFSKVGLIANHFEQCEYYLAVIFQTLCESENDAPFAAFGLVVSSNARLEMVSEAMAVAMPRKSNLEERVKKNLMEFKDCQTLRNRSMHASAVPELSADGVSWHGRPLWHQTTRYKNGKLKETSRFTYDDLDDAELRISLLVIDMRELAQDLEAFFAKRKKARLRLCSLRT